MWKLAVNGALERIKPSTTGFPSDYSFVRDDQGRMYWADRENACQKLIRKNKDGTITKLGDQCFDDIRRITASSDGTIYLMDLFDLKKNRMIWSGITKSSEVIDKGETLDEIANVVLKEMQKEGSVTKK